VGPWRRDRFDFLSTAADVVREVTPEDAPPEALDQYRALLFHAFHHWSSGRRLIVLEPGAARYLVETSPLLDGWDFRTPASSVYLQLPANLFWSSISPEIPPEPVDGFFVTFAEPDNVPGEIAAANRTSALQASPGGLEVRSLEVLVVLGIRRSRAGFSVIPVSTEVGAGIPQPWSGEGRAEGDFKNVLPGGEIQGLYSMLTTGEVLKLVARAFWYIDRFPDALVDETAGEPRTAESDPPTSHLDYTRVTLGQAAQGGAEPA
jgi:hypothetical protein